MSKKVRLTIFWTLMLVLPFIMGMMHKRFGMAGLVPFLAIALLMGLSYFPHFLGED